MQTAYQWTVKVVVDEWLVTVVNQYDVADVTNGKLSFTTSVESGLS